jgi:hypothetical protein
VVIESATLEYSGDGDVTGTLVPAINNVIPATQTASSSAGCLTSDFIPASATEPQVQRGTCTFEKKVNNAVAAGYDAVVIFNEGQPGRDGLLPGVTIGSIVPIPVVGVSYADAELKLVPTQKLRFAFWCAEEAGLLGSEHYVENLSDLGRNLDESLVTIGSAARFSSCDVVF